jgi:hypothetical protein
LLNLLLRPWRWRRYFPPKRRWSLTDYTASYPRRWYSNPTRSLPCSQDQMNTFHKHPSTFQINFNIEEYHLLGYNAVWSAECQPTFRR